MILPFHLHPKMLKIVIFAIVGVVAVALIGALIYSLTRPKPPSTEFQVRSVVNGFGDEIGQVSLSTTTAALHVSMNKHYALYIRPDLLEQWEAKPSTAPGRVVSGPQSDRIEIQSLTKSPDGTYAVEANVVTRESTTSTGPAGTPVHIVVAMGPDGWQISQYTMVSPTTKP